MGIAVVLVIASAVWAGWARPTGNAKPCAGSYLYEYFGVLGAVKACWCFQAGHHIYLHGIFFRDTMPETASSRSNVLSLFLSLLSVFCVIGFAKQADSVPKRGGIVGVKDSVEHGINGHWIEGQMTVPEAIVEQGTSSRALP